MQKIINLKIDKNGEQKKVDRVQSPSPNSLGWNNASTSAAQNPPVRQPEQDQRTTLTGAGTWEYQTPAFDPEGEVRIRELVNLICENPIDDYLYSIHNIFNMICY